MDLARHPAGKTRILPVIRISLIVAASRNGVIGRGNQLPWRLPDDLHRFKLLTMGHTIVMGRRTFESIGRPLPGRTNVVVSRRPGFAPPGVTVERSLEAALACAGADETFVIGGEVVFRQALPRADRVHLTLVDADVEGDVFFPPLDPREWRQISSEPRIADERHEYPFQFLVYDRILI